MTMPDIRCEYKDKQGNYHIMKYQDFGYMHNDNGYYCSVCDHVEKDRDWIAMEEEVKADMLRYQAKRKIDHVY